MVVAVAMGLGYGNNQVNVLNQTQVLFRTTKSIRERYKHQQSNVLRKVNKVVERV